MENRELKYCPFCGNTDLELYEYDPFDGYQGNLSRWKIHCVSCGCSMQRPKKDNLITAWNRRAEDGKP